MEKTPWTRLEGSAIWDAAEIAHKTPDWRVFHDFSHPKRLYWHAKNTLDLPYCPHLDEAILTHDVIFDDLAEPERRSAQWAMEWGVSHKTVDLIMSTAGHVPCGDNRMILLDLSNMMFQDERIASTEANRQEFIRRTNGTESEFSEKTTKYLSGLHARISSRIETTMPFGDAGYFERILHGIDDVLHELRPRDLSL